jgi:hypothetical protein
LEFAKKPNPDLTPEITERMLGMLFDELVIEFRTVHDVDVPSDRSSLVDLDSTTASKFSRHWIVHLPPHGALFPDARDAGYFVRGFVSRMMVERENGELRSKGRGLLADHLLVYVDDDDDGDDDHGDDGEDGHDGKKGEKGRRRSHFIDMGVYTRNRIFRLLGSTKFGKPTEAALRIAEANRYPFPVGFDNTKFYKPAMTTTTTMMVEGGRRVPPPPLPMPMPSQPPRTGPNDGEGRDAVLVSSHTRHVTTNE